MDQRIPEPVQGGARDAFEARAERVRAVIALEEPDRVPFYFSIRFWPARLGGFTYEKAMYEPACLADATRDLVIEFAPDLYQLPTPLGMYGPALDGIDLKALVWPGHGAAADVSYQYLDKEFMGADEYDDYLFDPTGFLLRKLLPRIAGAYEGFADFPDFATLYHTKYASAARAFAREPLAGALRTLAEAGRQLEDGLAEARRCVEELEEAGFPFFAGGQTTAPFDLIADYYRGSKGAMLDMFRCPDKLLQVMEKVRVLFAREVLEGAQGKWGSHVFIPLHWGLDGFMSEDQFKTFFWPQLQDMMLAFIDAGLVPYVFWEGDCGTRLEIISDIPPGKAIYKFERTDLFEAKKVLGDVVCIQGNVPASILNFGEPEVVDEYCKRLIGEVAPGGGFILDGASGVPDEALRPNIEAMNEAVHKYGVYT